MTEPVTLVGPSPSCVKVIVPLTDPSRTHFATLAAIFVLGLLLQETEKLEGYKSADSFYMPILEGGKFRKINLIGGREGAVVIN